MLAFKVKIHNHINRIHTKKTQNTVKYSKVLWLNAAK